MTNNKYPRYISTNPTGQDLLDGKSQTKISKAIAEHIKYIDSLSEKDKLMPKMPRVIGIEGKWGSGKSNVLKRLEFKDLIDEPIYKFFTYDAWANQEDLQRRTILEQLTAYLIDDRRLLKDKVKVRMQDVDKNKEFHTIDKMVTWKEKLDMLMAKRVKNITRSVSPLNMEFKLFMITLALTPMCIALMNALKFDGIKGWLYFGITIFATLLPAIISSIIIWRNKNLSFKNVLLTYQATTENKTTHQVVNESEPTIHEFSTWMKEISNGLKEFKLIVIFDNMDRLPADKVKKLWSSIHSIFASEEYQNIWCIIPYDFEHLSCAFGNNETEREQLTKYFIDKSFPVVYRVPEPVVIDYKKIFNEFFIQAFDTNVGVNDIDIINRCYRVTFPKPNIRAIISFINRLVTLAKVYGTSISPIGMAIYLLKEDNLIKHPTSQFTDASTGNLEVKEKSVTTDEYILSNAFLSGLEKIIQDKTNLQKEISALVYGIDPERAYQLPMYNALKDCFENNESQTSLNTYAKHPLFASVLIEIVHQIDTTYYQNVTTKLAEITDSDISVEAQASIQQSWDYLAGQYVRLNSPVRKYSNLEKNILCHVNDEKQKQVAKEFCTILTSDQSVKGDDLFNTLTELFNEPFANNWDISDICPKTYKSAEQFVVYVKAALSDYKQFPVYTDSQDLNSYLTDKLLADEDYTNVIEILRDDKNYEVISVADNAIIKFSEEKSSYLIAVRLLHIIKLFYSKADINPSNEYLISLWQKIKQDEKDSTQPSDEYKELYALLAVSYPGNLQGEPQWSDIDIAERTLFFTTTSKLISLSIQYPGDSALQGLLVASLINKVSDDEPSINGGFVALWNQLLSNNPVIKINHLLDFSEKWGYDNLIKEEEGKNINQLLPNQEWIDEMFKSESHIGKVLSEKAISEIKSISSDQFFQMQTLLPTNNYWYKVLESLINNDKMANPLGNNLKKIVVKALQLIANNNLRDNIVIHKLLSLGYDDYPSYATDINDIRRQIFLRANGYVISNNNFPILHKWLEQTGINEPGNINDSADTILAPIVDDAKCQQIILSNGDYYRPIIEKSTKTSSALHNKLKKLLKSENGLEFVQYIKSIVTYEAAE